MRKSFKRLLAILLTTIMLLSLAPTAFAADPGKISGSANASVHVFTKAENAAVENDVFAKIEAVKDSAARPMGGIGKMTEADYISIIPQVVKAITGSSTYVRGSLQRNGNFLVWQTTAGIPCCYDPRMEAKLHNTDDDPTPVEIAAHQAEADALLESVRGAAELNGGNATSTKIGLIQPYWESSSSYADSSFTSYSPYYKTMWQNLYNATGGSGIRYSMTNATVDNVASTIQQCGLVIFDSHGTTDYSGSNGDYTSRANSSYLCLTSNSGVTSTDTAARTGTYGTYYNALKGSGYAYVNGDCIANHMSGNAPHSLVYMGICLGMATDKMFSGLRSKGVEVVYGYSQSVSFKGERQYMESILGYVKNGDNFGTALSKAKSSLGKWDPAYSSYSESQARSNKVAFPIAVSSEDSYPGQGNVDKVQTVYSTWSLFGSAASYTVTATSNNTSYGTVSVSGNVITASPKSGYYAAGYTVTSGSATVVQSGNTFTVTPSSDCTVRINFAAKTSYTVTLKANGSTYQTLSAYSGDSVTLPSSATAVSGYTFAGWAASTVAETTSKPSYYAPGASYAPTANVTLYALYTRSEGGTGATVYQLASSLTSGGQYILVASGAISGTSGYAVGNTAVTSSHYLTPVAVTVNSDNTVTASSSNLAKVLWTASGSSSSGFTFYNASSGKYMGLDSSEYLAPTSGSLAWKYTSAGYLDNQTDSEGYYYLSYSSSSTVRYTTSKNGEVIKLYQAVNGSTTYYTTSPSTQTHEHSYGAWTSNNNGTHSRTCSCGDVETANCTYNDVVTPPTTTSQGYTTHTCTVCGYSYRDSYTDPVSPTTYTVSFSVPSGVSAVASQSVTAGSSITLPSAGAPSGYTFLGWVTSAVNNSTTAPGTILTGSYKPTASITLKALYTYSTGSGVSGYQLVTSAPSDWTGKYVITYGNSSSLYALKGLSSNKSYESSSAGGATAFASTGMSLSNGVLTNVSDAYAFNIASYNGKYTIRNASTGTYLGSYRNYLYSRTSLSSTYCLWTLAMNGSAVKATNSYSSRYPYLSFSSSKYFMINSSANSSIYFWKLTDTGATYYTTVI